jgi:outer membrane protein OmpA-like peptidoglycan-associated protein
MRNTLFAGALAFSLLGTGCATKKYVAQQVAPVETHVSGVETKNDAKNAEQDKTIADQGKQTTELEGDLSRTKERLTDTDSKATAAGQAAQQASQSAQQANQAAGNAQKAADGARSFAEQGVNRLERTMDAMNKFQMAKSVTVLFSINQSKLGADAKLELDDFAKQTDGLQRYVIEVQGFTDKTGPVALNESLSQARAEEVARYLVNEHKIPVRTITTLGSGYALPVADDKTRDGRKQNRRVEIRLFVPEAGSGPSTGVSKGEWTGRRTLRPGGLQGRRPRRSFARRSARLA